MHSTCLHHVTYSDKQTQHSLQWWYGEVGVFNIMNTTNIALHTTPQPLPYYIVYYLAYQVKYPCFLKTSQQQKYINTFRRFKQKCDIMFISQISRQLTPLLVHFKLSKYVNLQHNYKTYILLYNCMLRIGRHYTSSYNLNCRHFILYKFIQYKLYTSYNTSS